ncbi:MAG: deoxyribodipyrimidine photo-lyase, partial [Paracoccaceae bacterium]
MRKKIALCWFRQDLRLSDNLALLSASKAQNVLPLYILDTVNSGRDFLGSA